MKLKKEILELLLTIDRNENAHDDDLQDSYDEVVRQWDLVIVLVDKFIREG